MKKHFKHAIKLVIDADGSIYTLVFRAGKRQLIAALDALIPDDVEPADLNGIK